MARDWRTLVPLIRAIPGNVGCCWHVVVNDGNFSRGHIAYCKAHVDPRHRECVALGAVIDGYSLTQISKAARRNPTS